MIDRSFVRHAALGVAASLSLFFGAVSPSAAEPTASPTDKAAAEVLYDRGIALMKEGKTAEACGQFEQSQAIESGIGTMLHLAECYEQLGRTASAWALFREAASAARFEGQSDRVKWGNDRAAALAPKLSMLTLQVPPGDQVQGFTLTRDGNPVVAGLFNVPVPVDPGVHKLHARAPGYEDWTGEVTVGSDADSVTQSIPVLIKRPEPVAAAVNPEPAAAAQTPAQPSVASTAARPTPRASRVQKIVGLAVGGVGVGALVVGGVFGMRASSKKSDVDTCGKTASCTSKTGEELVRSGKSAARLSTVFVIGGAALAATGVVLYLTAGGHEEAPQVALGLGPDSARLTLGGAF